MRYSQVFCTTVLSLSLVACNGAGTSNKSGNTNPDMQPAAAMPAANANNAAAPGTLQVDPNTLVWTFNGKRIQAVDAAFAEITPSTPNSFATTTYLSVALSANPNICAQLADPANLPNMMLISIVTPQALPSSQTQNFTVSQDSNTTSSGQDTSTVGTAIGGTMTTTAYTASAEYSEVTTTAGMSGLPRYTALPTTYANGSGQATYQPGSVTMTNTAADPNSLTVLLRATGSATGILQDGNIVSVKTDQVAGSIVAKRCPNLNVGIDVSNESTNPFSPKWAGRPQMNGN